MNLGILLHYLDVQWNCYRKKLAYNHGPASSGRQNLESSIVTHGNRLFIPLLKDSAHLQISDSTENILKGQTACHYGCAKKLQFQHDDCLKDDSYAQEAARKAVAIFLFFEMMKEQ